jgi:putative acetyltransferase
MRFICCLLSGRQDRPRLRLRGYGAQLACYSRNPGNGIRLNFVLLDGGFPMKILPGDLDDPRVRSLLEHHLATARAATAPGSHHALDVEGLKAPDISFWTAWDGEVLLGTGALKRLSSDHGEVKSMHTAEACRRNGVARAMLLYLIDAARSLGMSRLSLETGSWAYFEPARALYRSVGFVECAPFGEYARDPNSVFMSLDLRGFG